MKEEYDNIEAANIALEEKVVNFKKKLCPLFKDKCIGRNCHAFYEGRVYKVSRKDTVFCVSAPCCCSPLITGHIDCDNY